MSKILLAEDEDAILWLVWTKLASKGHSVVLVNNGADALAEARLENFDLLLLDIRMAGPSGLDVTRRVRHDSSIQSVPIILLSALASARDIALGYEAGANDYVTKPFSPRDLLRRVELLVEDPLAS